MSYYDRIASPWHEATGQCGGPFRRLVLNDAVLDAIPSIAGASILELGAGNGYFLPLLLKRFRSQAPSRVAVTDASYELLAVAEREFRVENGEYSRLDVRARYPFDAETFDLILAVMVFNEVSTTGLRKALAECRRVLKDSGQLIAVVAHPDFVESLQQRGELRGTNTGQVTMPSSGSLRVPVVRRTTAAYDVCLGAFGWEYEAEDVYPNRRVLRERPEFKAAGHLPLARMFKCWKTPIQDTRDTRVRSVGMRPQELHTEIPAGKSSS